MGQEVDEKLRTEESRLFDPAVVRPVQERQGPWYVWWISDQYCQYATVASTVAASSGSDQIRAGVCSKVERCSTRWMVWPAFRFS